MTGKCRWSTPRLVVKKRGVRTKVVQQVGGQDSVHRVSGKLFAFGLSGPLPLSFSSQFSALIEPQHVSLVGDMDANTGSRRSSQKIKKISQKLSTLQYRAYVVRLENRGQKRVNIEAKALNLSTLGKFCLQMSQKKQR